MVRTVSFMGAYIPRVLDTELDDVLAGLPAVLIDGPKGVGKTETAARRAATIWELDDEAQHSILDADPKTMLADPTPILLDEWHRLPKLWDTVRRAVDADRSPGRILLTGSAPTIASHSGAARITDVRMRPLTLTERLDTAPSVSLSAMIRGDASIVGVTSFLLSDYVAEMVAGGFPGMRHLHGRLLQRQLDGYLRRIVDHDFPESGVMIRRPETVMAWLRAYAAATATTASFETIRTSASRGETPPARSTVQPYIDLLERLRILDQIDGWQPTRNHLRRLTVSPKHHLADPALAARLLRVTASGLLHGDEGAVQVPRDGTLLGALFESMVALSVRTFAQAVGAHTFHLRDRDGTHEIDFIVQDDAERLVAVEAKLSASIDTADVRHLLWLRDRVPDSIADLAVVTTGPRAYRRPDGVAVVPLALLGP